MYSSGSRPLIRRVAGALLLTAMLTAGACGGSDSDPAGPGGSSGVSVGPAGGTADFASGAVRLVVPAGALSSTVELVVAATTSFPQVSGVVGGSVYEFGPDGTQFAEPVTLSIEYLGSNVPAGVNESELRLYTVVGNTWQLVPGSTVNAGSDLVTGSISSFSKYGVRALPVEMVQVTPPSQTVNVLSTVQFSAQPKGPGGVNLMRDVTWSSSNDAVATVDDNGVVTGQSGGTAMIIATTADGVQGSAMVTVEDPVITVDVTPEMPAINVGQTVAMTATPRGIKGNEIAGKTPTWESSNDNVASVNANGIVGGEGVGSATITATIDGVEGSTTVAVSISLQVFAGTWLGTWFNESFTTTGPASLVITVNEQAGTMQFTLDLGGLVFGLSDPPPAVFAGTFNNGAFTITGTSATFGQVTLNGNGAAFAGTGVGVAGFDPIQLTGTVTPTTITITYVINLTGGTFLAQGVITLNKQ